MWSSVSLMAGSAPPHAGQAQWNFACREITIVLWGCKKHGYYATSQPCSQPFEDVFNEDLEESPKITGEAKGKSPEEAVAKLWLKLNKK